MRKRRVSRLGKCFQNLSWTFASKSLEISAIGRSAFQDLDVISPHILTQGLHHRLPKGTTKVARHGRPRPFSHHRSFVCSRDRRVASSEFRPPPRTVTPQNDPEREESERGRKRARPTFPSFPRHATVDAHASHPFRRVPPSFFLSDGSSSPSRCVPLSPPASLPDPRFTRRPSPAPASRVGLASRTFFFFPRRVTVWWRKALTAFFVLRARGRRREGCPPRHFPGLSSHVTPQERSHAADTPRLTARKRSPPPPAIYPHDRSGTKKKLKSNKMGMGLEISGNNMANMPQRAAGPKMQVGERLSMCGQFVINGRGAFRGRK